MPLPGAALATLVSPEPTNGKEGLAESIATPPEGRK